MRQLRPALIALGVLGAIALLLWLVSTLATLYAGVSTLSPWLAQLITVLLAMLLIGAVGVLAYYGWLFLRPRQARPLPPPPETPTEAAAATLAGVEQQTAQIQDEIARQALQARSQQLSASFRQSAYRIVLFGSGSVGKTSLANALMGEIAGETGATKGTTTAEQTYRLAVEGLNRDIWLIDSPGILTVEPPDQEARTRQLATEADLLLYVIDNDLHRAEYEAIYALLQLGKRSLLVLNKTDLYTPTELEQILTRLRERLNGVLAPADVVAIAARPPALFVKDNDWITPEPNITDLVDRIIAVLRTEGEDLIADNLLLQSQRLSQDTRALLAAQRQQQADAVVDRYQWIGAGVLAATPLPVVDMLATAAINTQMVVELGRVYGVAVSIEDARALATSLAKTMASLGMVKGALKLLTLGLQANIATAVAGKLIQGVSAAYLTRIAGKSFITYFQQNQDWGDGGIQTVVEKQYQLNRREAFVKAFVQSAVDRLAEKLV
ncbi:MAG: GTP-binding protein [Cyanobacteria bacterium J06554_6]